MDPTAELQDAVRHHRAGRVDLAEPVYRRILADHPDHPEARHLVAVLAQQRGRSTYAFYRRMGVLSAIAQDEADYVAKAVAVAAEPRPHRLPIQETAGTLYENREVLADIERFILDRVG